MDVENLTNEDFMHEALKEAEKAYEMGEVPIGAVIVKDGTVIGRGFNQVESAKDPTMHAEMIAIRKTAAQLGGWRLNGCSMYVTTEPCTMCAGAIVAGRIEKLVIGTKNPKAGACMSLKNLLQDERLNHSVDLETDILKEECEYIMKKFFKKLRSEK